MKNVPSAVKEEIVETEESPDRHVSSIAKPDDDQLSEALKAELANANT